MTCFKETVLSNYLNTSGGSWYMSMVVALKNLVHRQLNPGLQYYVLAVAAHGIRVWWLHFKLILLLSFTTLFNILGHQRRFQHRA